MNMKPLVQSLVQYFKTVMESVQPSGTCLSLCTSRTFTKQAPIAVTLKITPVPHLPDLWPNLMGGKKSKESTCRMSHMIHFQTLWEKKKQNYKFFLNITVLFSKNVFQKQPFTFSILQPSCSIHLPVEGEVPELIKMQNTSVFLFSSFPHFGIWNKVCSCQHTLTWSSS